MCPDSIGRYISPDSMRTAFCPALTIWSATQSLEAEMCAIKKSTAIKLLLVCFLVYFAVSSLPAAYGQDIQHSTQNAPSVGTLVEVTPLVVSQHFIINALKFSDGTVLEEDKIIGPPVPPPGYELERMRVELPEGSLQFGVATLTVPAYNWVFGCSAVSGAMIAAYYDRNGYPNIYTGPTNGGVMPLDNSGWPTWSDGSTTYPNLPLAASRNGVDGRAVRGSIDDYWVIYNSSASDPYITNGWTQHSWKDAIGDYMKTSQSAYSNVDGSTTFYNYTSGGSQLTCSQMVSYAIQNLDGTYGRKLFYEARGYTVTDCYNQRTDNNGGGFTFANYQAEIDAGRPVMLNLAGHTVVGVGYDRSSNTVYLHDTWDYNNHTMTWGGSYSGMALQSVSIVNLSPAPKVATSKIMALILPILYGHKSRSLPDVHLLLLND